MFYDQISIIEEINTLGKMYLHRSRICQLIHRSIGVRIQSSVNLHLIISRINLIIITGNIASCFLDCT
jgi:hypothetical protein